MKLYYNAFSRAARVRWMLEELEAKYDLVTFDFEKEDPEYLKIHPLGMVPAIVDDGKALFESSAIVMHLADKHPEKKLAPAVGSYDRALYYQWIFFTMTHLEQAVVEIYAQTSGLDEKDRIPKNLEWARGAFAESAAVVEKELATRDTIVPCGFTAADVILGSLLGWAKMLGILEPYPNLMRYGKAMGSRPANKRSRAE